MSGLHLFNFDIIVKLCLKTPCTQLLGITTSNAQFQPNKRSEERRFCVTWPQYEANCLAGTGIGHGTRSFCQRSGTRNIRSNYGHISFKKKKTIPSKCSRKYQVYIVKLLSDIYFRGLFLILQANESQIPSSISTEQHNYTVLLQTTTGHPFALLNIKLSLT